jgi:hypothetical protein
MCQSTLHADEDAVPEHTSRSHDKMTPSAPAQAKRCALWHRSAQDTLEVLPAAKANDEIIWPGSVHGHMLFCDAEVLLEVVQHHGWSHHRPHPEDLH